MNTRLLSGALLLCVLSLAGCAKEGGQSGGESNYGCFDKSRTKMNAQDTASGFTSSPNDEIARYVRQYKGPFTSAPGYSVDNVTLTITRDESREVAFVQREYRQDPNGPGQSGQYTNVDGLSTCQNVYDIPVQISFVGASENGEAIVKMTSEGSILTTSDSVMSSSTTVPLAQVETTAMPQLVAEGYSNITFVLYLDGMSTPSSTNAAVSGSASWQGERTGSVTSESRLESVGTFAFSQ